MFITQSANEHIRGYTEYTLLEVIHKEPLLEVMLLIYAGFTYRGCTAIDVWLQYGQKKHRPAYLCILQDDFSFNLFAR